LVFPGEEKLPSRNPRSFFAQVLLYLILKRQFVRWTSLRFRPEQKNKSFGLPLSSAPEDLCTLLSLSRVFFPPPPFCLESVSSAFSQKQQIRLPHFPHTKPCFGDKRGVIHLFFSPATLRVFFYPFFHVFTPLSSSLLECAFPP